MVIKMKNEALTALVGVSASETPKYLLLNNFLADFFEARSHEEDDYTFSFFEEQGILVCQESNSEVKKDLERSFEKFLQYFTGREMLSGIKSGKEKIYMPLSLDMLGSANVNLRHLLYHLALSGGKPSEEERIREELYQYLYGDSTGIYDIVRRFCGIEKGRKDKVKEPGGFEKLREEPFFKKLGRRFYKDLHSLLTHPYFTGQDFYKRLDDLAMLLTMYVVFYFIRPDKQASFYRGQIFIRKHLRINIRNRNKCFFFSVRQFLHIGGQIFCRQLKYPPVFLLTILHNNLNSPFFSGSVIT